MPVTNNQELKDLLDEMINRPLREGQLSDKEQLALALQSFREKTWCLVNVRPPHHAKAGEYYLPHFDS